MGEDTYKELLALLQNQGRFDLADALFKVFIRNRKLSAENLVYKQVLQAGITVHIHNDGQKTLTHNPYQNPIQPFPRPYIGDPPGTLGGGVMISSAKAKEPSQAKA